MEAVVGGHRLRAGRPEHPSHESAASLPSVATSATPSAHELRRTNLRKRTGVRTGGGNQGGQEWGWGQGERRLRGVTGLGRTNRPGVE